MDILGRVTLLNNDAIDSTTGLAIAPTANDLKDGQIAVNYSTNDPCLFIKDNAGNIIKFTTEKKIAQTLSDILGESAADLSTLKELLSAFNGSENDVLTLIKNIQTELGTKASAATLNNHIASTSNPHSVTAAQVGALPVNGNAVSATYMRPIEISGFTGKTVGELKAEIIRILKENKKTSVLYLNINSNCGSLINNWSDESFILTAGSTYFNTEVTNNIGTDAYLRFTSYYGKTEYTTALVNGKFENTVEKVAFLSDNVASASKLNTSRTLWGQPFDGTKNVSGALTDVSRIISTGGSVIDEHLNINIPTKSSSWNVNGKNTDDTDITLLRVYGDGANYSGLTYKGQTVYNAGNANNATTGWTASVLKSDTLRSANNTHMVGFVESNKQLRIGTEADSVDIRFLTSSGGGASITSNSKLGIGTTNPTSKLHVSGNGIFSIGTSTAVPEIGDLYHGNTFCIVNGCGGSYNTPNYGLFTGILSTGAVWMQTGRADKGADSYNLLLQPNGGCVGIGVENRAMIHKLEVNGTTKTTNILTSNILPDGNATTNLKFLEGTTIRRLYFENAKSGAGVGSDWGHLVLFSGGMNERMRVNDAGNVGINTTSPTQKLDVNGIIRSNELMVNGGNIVDIAQIWGTNGDVNHVLYLGKANINEVNWVEVGGVWKFKHNAAGAETGVMFNKGSIESRGYVSAGGSISSGGSITATGEVIAYKAATALQEGTPVGSVVVYDGLDSTSPDVALSANMGRALNADVLATRTLANNAAKTATWSSITGTPDAFTPCEHNHYDSVYPSDRRLKHNIETIEKGLNYVLSMNPVKYVWSAEAISKFNIKESKAYGLIAQELELLLPECTTKIDGDTLGVDYIKIIPFLIAAIKDLDAKLAVTNQKINTMTKAQNRAYSASYTNEKEIELLKEQVAQQSEQINQLMNKLN